MSLKFRITSHLYRQGNSIEPKLRACICSSVSLRQDKDGSIKKSHEGKPTQLVGSPEVPKYIEKKKMISRAMQLYLEKRRKEDQFRMKNIKEITLGERHLANMMGVDVNELGPSDVRRAIRYILPSGLHSRKAKPQMEIPVDMLIQRKSESFSATGKPSHYLFYTLKPNYFELMHEMAMLFEEIRKEQAVLERLKKPLVPTTPEEVKEKEDFDRMVRQGIVSFDKLKDLFGKEKPSVADKEKFENLLLRIVTLPLAYKKKAFFDRFPRPDGIALRSDEEEQREVSTEDKLTAVAEGSRKTIKAQAEVRRNGSGEISINNESILYFEDIAHREAILFPVKFVGLLGKVDIEAHVTSSTTARQDCSSSQAGALRLAIARALQEFVSDEDIFKMERAGLLTRDPRMRERKKFGQEGARRKFTWKAR